MRENLTEEENQSPPPPDSYQRPFFRLSRGVIPLIVICLIAVFLYETYLPHASYAPAKEITISPGLGSRTIGALLKQEGVIRSKWAFVTYVSLRGEASSLKPGIYSFTPLSIRHIASTLVRGDADEISLTIPEGWNTIDIGRSLDARKMDGSAFIAHTARYHDNRFVLLEDKPDGHGLEGYLFPDTYRVFKSAPPKDLITKIMENLEKKFTPELRESVRLQNKTIFEIITMASLIENEVVSDADRALVSGILWKRLSIGMPLQVDATIAYIKKTKGMVNNTRGAISREDTKIDSSYNTYRYRGLPAGPIGNPGLSAITAAVYPKSSPFFYYLSTPEGRTIFSKTLEEHNTAKAEYLK